MTGPDLGSTPEDREVLRQLGIAAELLEILARYGGTPQYEPLAAEFNRRYRARDVVSGLVLASQYFGQVAAADPDRYLPMLSAWQRAREVVEALAPAVDDPEVM